MTVELQSTEITDDAIFYPESDGKPMGESDLHREIMYAIIHLLQRAFAGQPVYVTGNLLLYYQEGDPRRFVVPDCFVVRDTKPGLRRIYKLWEEGKGPDVVFEVSSKSTRRVDLGPKKALYARLGVAEYFIYDPTADYLRPPLAGFELTEGEYRPLPTEQPAHPDEARVFISRRLGLRLAVDTQHRLHFYHLAGGRRLLSDAEARLEAETERQHAEAELQRAEAERRRAEAERRRAEAAHQGLQRKLQEVELENRRLQEELARLRRSAS